MNKPVIGVLAVQGAFIEHRQILAKLGVETFEIRQKADLLNNPLDGLILPGGESTVQGKLLRELDLFDLLLEKIQKGLPVFGTCAGLILLASHLSNDGNTYFGTLPVTVQRNAYGRQLGSFFTDQTFRGVTDSASGDSSANETAAKKVPMTFIRAPLIESAGEDVSVLSTVPARTSLAGKQQQEIVAVRYKNQLGVSFHPELNEDTRIHQYFVDICLGRK